jgi:hypothetical protein
LWILKVKLTGGKPGNGACSTSRWASSHAEVLVCPGPGKLLSVFLLDAVRAAYTKVGASGGEIVGKRHVPTARNLCASNISIF